MKIPHWLILALSLLVVAAAAAGGFVVVRNAQTETRGVTYLSAAQAGQATPPAAGVNVALEQYSQADLDRACRLIQAGGWSWVRQHFYWNEIEPRRGEFEWTASDRLVAEAERCGLSVLAVLDTSPAWARSATEQDVVTAPPLQPADYGRFVATFAGRYGSRVPVLQLWDNPNVPPNWGRRNADAMEYTALLRRGAEGARSANPHVSIVSAGLAPNEEKIRGHPVFSDILFLRGMYDAGAREYFDILGAKPYGMWTGPDDRRVSPDVLNFSRVILLREEMTSHGDAAKPVWAVEFGWSALPAGWSGAPSPWGTDTDQVSSARLTEGIRRARSEWPWMTGLIVQTFRPNAAAGDPIWGLALVDKDFQPRPLYTAAVAGLRMPVQPAAFDFTRLAAILAALGAVGAVAAVCGLLAARKIPWGEDWRRWEERFRALPEGMQWGIVAAGVLALAVSPQAGLNLVCLAAVVLLFALRLDLGLGAVVLTIPFYLLPKTLIGSAQFSLVELLTLAAAVAYGVRRLLAGRLPDRTGLSRLASVDLAVFFFVLAGGVSVSVASNFGVANREFRIIVLEPALLFALIRLARLDRAQIERLVHALILSAAAVALVGVYQYLFTDYVIVAEGVRRVLAVYGSPNNLALYLDRTLPLVVALALATAARRWRWAYAIAAALIAVCLYLTFSRGAWLLALPAGGICLALLSGRRARIAVGALLVVAAVGVIPFLRTERAQSLFQSGTGTGFFRVSVWESGLAMIRDHPLLGVGLDNFLYEYPKYMQPEAWREPNLSHPHNVILDFWVRMGIPGLAALVWLVAEFYRRGLAARATNRALAIGLLAGMTAALAHGLIDAMYFYVDLAFVFMFELAVVTEMGRPAERAERV